MARPQPGGCLGGQLGAGGRATRDVRRTGSGRGLGTRLAYVLARVQKKVNLGSGPRGSGECGDRLGGGTVATVGGL